MAKLNLNNMQQASKNFIKKGPPTHLVIRKLKHKISTKKSMAKNYKHSFRVAVKYIKNNRALISNVERKPDTKIAVVVHLYYIDSWPQIRTSLERLNEPFDLFVSMPKQNLDFINEITENYKSAYIYESPNRGRDVLPFVKLAPILTKKGYKYILKLHSKKSTHRKDGVEWLDGILDSLLPDKRHTINDLMEILKDKKTGVVGPQGQYLQLSVNFEANGVHMTSLLNSIYHDKKKTREALQLNRSNYGFFAGTMFWARLDALKPIVNKSFRVFKFEPEAGQIDGTLAHALERIFSLVPELEKKKLYEIGVDGVKEIGYRTDNIPDWSDVYIGPKPQ